MKDLSHLPVSDGTSGRPPLPVPELGAELVAAWIATLDRHEKAKVNPDKPWRASYASTRCDRALYYQMTDAPRAERTVADTWRMELGTLVHHAFEEAVRSTMDPAYLSPEVPVDLNVLPGSARTDYIRDLTDISDPIEGYVNAEAVDIKTINGFGYKKAATTFKGPPEGPKYGHELQVASVVVERNLRQGRLIYLAMECVSPGMNRSGIDLNRFVGEWVISRERCDFLVRYEAKRIQRLLAAQRNGLLPTRTLSDETFPAEAFIANPQSGDWRVLDADGKIAAAGSTWHCDYCDFRPLCVADGPGNQPLELF